MVGCWCLGPGAWHPLDPSWVPLPVPTAGEIYWGHGVRGLASPDPSWVSFRGVPAPQIMEAVEVFQLVPTAGEQIVVCQCHRSCRSVEVASLCGVLPQVQLLDKAVYMPVASNDKCLGLSVQKTADPAVAVLKLWSMSLLCRSSFGSLAGGASNSVQFIARVRGPSSVHRDRMLSARVWCRKRGGHFSRSSGSSRS